MLTTNNKGGQTKWVVEHKWPSQRDMSLIVCSRVPKWSVCVGVGVTRMKNEMETTKNERKETKLKRNENVGGKLGKLLEN